MNPQTVGTIQYNAVINTAQLQSSANQANQIVQDSGDKGAEGFTKAMGVVTAVSAAAFATVAVLAVKSFASYEQLTGGVETLFKSSAGIVEGYANNAYKTAGMSANQYMDTVTSFSASLLQGLGGDTKKAAEVANTAVTDMADNANKMGTSTELIQNAYQGFAKDNYTMLDNLKLGYGGTQEEMARLINDSGVMGKSFTATAENVKDIPFDKMIEAIHNTQTAMGITGTTAKEASSTISGSWSSLTAAFTNVLTGVEGSGTQLSDTVLNMFDQLVQKVPPIVANMASGIFDALKTVIDDKLGNGAFDIISTIAVAFGALAVAVQVYQTAVKVAAGVQALFNAVMAANPVVIITIAVIALVAALIYFFTQTDTGKKIVQAFSDWITNTFVPAIASIGQWFSDAWTNVVNVWNGAVAWFQGVWDGIVAVFSAVIGFYISVYAGAWNAIVAIFGVAVGWFADVWNGIMNVFSAVGGWFGSIFGGAVNAIRSVFGGIVGFFGGVWNSIMGIFNGIASAVGNAIGGAVKGAVNGALTTAENAVNGFINLINGAINIINKIPGVNIGHVGRVSFPRLAEGGIVMNRPGGIMANIGEGSQPEAVIPLDRLDKMISGDGRGGATYNITMNGVNDPAEFTRQLQLATQGRF